MLNVYGSLIEHHYNVPYLMFELFRIYHFTFLHFILVNQRSSHVFLTLPLSPPFPLIQIRINIHFFPRTICDWNSLSAQSRLQLVPGLSC